MIRLLSLETHAHPPRRGAHAHRFVELLASTNLWRREQTYFKEVEFAINMITSKSKSQRNLFEMEGTLRYLLMG